MTKQDNLFTSDGRASDSARGSTFDPVLDGERLGKQFDLIMGLMRDGRWRTLGEIADRTEQPQASISARLREARGKGHAVDKRRRGRPSDGLWEYRVRWMQGEVKTATDWRARALKAEARVEQLERELDLAKRVMGPQGVHLPTLLSWGAGE